MNHKIARREIGKGKSFYRALLNEELESSWRSRIEGRCLDLGAGKSPSYHRVLNLHRESVRLITADVGQMKPSVVTDLEEPLPFKDNSFDFVFMFNILEHIYNYERLVRESYRVLDENGKLLGGVPFLVKFHPDPHDFHRLTQEGVARVLKKSGYKKVRVKPLSIGPFIASVNLLPIPDFTRLFSFLFAFYLTVFGRKFPHPVAVNGQWATSSPPRNWGNNHENALPS